MTDIGAFPMTGTLEPSTKIYIKEASPEKGRGVFAKVPIKKGEIIETCPVIPDHDWEAIEKTALKDFYYNFGEEDVCIALGFGSLYNHSNDPNADIIRDVKNLTLQHVAIRDIEKDEEICFKYACGEFWKKN